MTDYRQTRIQMHAAWTGLSWPLKVAAAGGMAAFLALMANLSFPLPFTPVPFSFQVLGVALAGAYLGRNYGVLAIAFYILAGAIGLQVFADQESTGIEVLTGHTAGYIVGFALAAYLIGWYVERRRARLLDRRTATVIAGTLGAAALAALLAILWVSLNPAAFEAAWSDAYANDISAARFLVWVMSGLLALGAVVAFLLVKRARGTGWEKLNLFLVVMAGIVLIHACGVIVLKPTLGYSWPQAIALGSLVFLPFDIVKAGLAVALATVFLPTRDDEGSAVGVRFANARTSGSAPVPQSPSKSGKSGSQSVESVLVNP